MHTLALLFVAVQATDSVTLEQALTRARASRPQVTAAAGAVQRARGLASVGTTIPNPSLQLEFDESSPSRKATVSQPLGWLVHRSADRAAGRAGIARAVADSTQSIADLGLMVRRAFYGALASDALLALVGEQAAIADSLARLAEQRLASGDISALERDQVVQESGRVRLSLSQSRQASSVARVALARAIAWSVRASGTGPAPAGALDAGLDARLDARLDPARTDAPQLGSRDVADIPLLRAAIADSMRDAARLRSARLARIPIPALVAGREWGGAPGDHNTILGFAVPVPIWSSGGERVTESRGAAVESAALASEARLEVTAQLEEARIRVVESASRARLARDSLLIAARALRAGTVRLYESGRTGVLPVFDALRAERDVSQALVRELLAFQEARAVLIALLGGWD